ncbi:acyl-CoA thioesterase [Derxia gummosa]|uniref:Acyl-CoA thioesterase n=1 Tax=Derxia gummosa DSM 723 TaxID=1121388 RepID=A0A8B6X6V4_9BURK|nr:acyl-CoA thioesterase [Derxia gummosa]
MNQPLNPPHLPGVMPVLRLIPMPADANPSGDVFGGWIMSQVDLAGSVPAVLRAGGRVATVAVNAFAFKAPVNIGDLVSFFARIVKTGRTSITVEVEVWSQRRWGAAELVQVTDATLTYVAVGSDGKSRELPAEA